MDILKGARELIYQISRGLDIVRDFSIRQGDRIGLDNKANYKLQEHSMSLSASSKKLILLEESITTTPITGVNLFVKQFKILAKSLDSCHGASLLL